MKYSHGAMPDADHEALIGTIRKAINEFDHPTFIEIGILRGKTSLLILQLLNESGKKAHYIGTDINRASIKRLNRKYNSKSNFARNVKKEFILGGIKAVEQERAHWVFVDGCHCYDCCLSDIQIARKKVVQGGYLIMHDADEKHEAEFASQTYHGKPWRPIAVARAVKDADLKEFDFEFEVKGLAVSDDPKRKVRGGLLVYRRK